MHEPLANQRATAARMRQWGRGSGLPSVQPLAGGPLQALAWYRGQGIPRLGDATAEALVKQDQADVVRAWLDAYAAGAYA